MTSITVPSIMARKNGEKIVVITAYSARMSQLIDPIADIILVGDSLGMTLHGLSSTLEVTSQMMVMAGKAVCSASKKALVVVDLPFSTYEADKIKAYETASHILAQTGCHAVKLEGGTVMAETIAFLTARHIPVMGHVGLLPQSVHYYGGYGARGKTPQEKQILLDDIKTVAEAGAFSIVIEAVDEEIAIEMTESVSVPTIGIGASLHCDGQVLVSDDLLGLTEKTAKFVKKYADFTMQAEKAFADFAHEVRTKQFPTSSHIYHIQREDS